MAASEMEALMTARLCSLLALIGLLITPALAKNKKPVLPEYVLRARTVLVVIDPDAGEPLDQPNANAMARESVEKALMEWGRFRLVMDGAESDLIISVRTGDDRAVRPTIKGGPLDQRPGVGQTTDSSVRIGGQRGQPPPLNDPSMDPQSRGPRVTNEVGPSEDMFAVYHGGLSNPLDAPPVWRYIAKDCLRAPQVSAVENFRKTIAEAEKPQPSKKP
jgi:hypothetical protein